MGRALLSPPRLIQIGFVAAVFLTWHLVTINGGVSPIFLPTLAAVWHKLIKIFAAGTVVSALGTTLSTVAVAYAIAFTLGIVVGYIVSRSRYLMRVFEPLFSSMFAIPITLFFPLFILFFGIGPESKVAYGATYAFFPIVLNTISGFGYANRKLVDAARSMGASDYQLFRRVLLPGALPIVLSGMRIAFIVCFGAVLGGETLSSITGLGHQISNAAELMEIAELYAWILFVIVTAFTLITLVSHFETVRRDIGDAAGH